MPASESERSFRGRCPEVSNDPRAGRRIQGAAQLQTPGELYKGNSMSRYVQQGSRKKESFGRLTISPSPLSRPIRSALLSRLYGIRYLRYLRTRSKLSYALAHVCLLVTHILSIPHSMSYSALWRSRPSPLEVVSQFSFFILFFQLCSITYTLHTLPSLGCWHVLFFVYLNGLCGLLCSGGDVSKTFLPPSFESRPAFFFSLLLFSSSCKRESLPSLFRGSFGGGGECMRSTAWTSSWLLG